MNESLPAIAVLQNGQGGDVQRLFRACVDRWRSNANIAGLVEADDRETPRRSRHLVSIADGSRYRIFQDLGPGVTGCQIDPESLIAAGESVRRRIEAGCDLVILSKFAKLEAENRSGLMPALVSAVEAGIPVLTSVAAPFEAAWSTFAGDHYVSLPPSETALEDWWRGVSASAPAMR